jgi:hypothetical protein
MDGATIIEADGGSNRDDDQHFVGDAASDDDAQRIADWHNAAVTGRRRLVSRRSPTMPDTPEETLDGSTTHACSLPSTPVVMPGSPTMPDTPWSRAQITDDIITGEDIRAAIAEACSLTNPRLSEVEWDDVAAILCGERWVERDPEPGEPVAPFIHYYRRSREPHDA